MDTTQTKTRIDYIHGAILAAVAFAPFTCNRHNAIDEIEVLALVAAGRAGVDHRNSNGSTRYRLYS